MHSELMGFFSPFPNRKILFKGKKKKENTTTKKPTYFKYSEFISNM